ncbi:phage holin family protein [Parasedimentitalea psychrophila]|uniref:Phage holin family protein n=1 Tax=Parasedimentitalea psychrophila TaxID=2997337 RepID=A0A9Y2P361_9RHOB|nr:phage holin family protein [Parasedimentitalea psychrophila]WIY23939.1 phage holin family protein [Parasedimentitalea psychrophila]
MNRISRNISIIMRAERLIAQRHLAILRRQTGLLAAAGLVAGLGIIMLNMAAYLGLADVVSKPLAALIVAAVNLVLAGILASIAGNANFEAETAPVAEVRDLAMEDLEAEFQVAVGEAKAAVDGIKRMANDPLGMIVPGVAGAVAKAVVKNLKS